MFEFGRILAALAVGLMPCSAFADAATHELKLRLETLPKTDCDGDGSCVPACMVYADIETAKNGPKETRPLQVQFWYTSKNTGDETAITLSFDGIRQNELLSTTGHAPGHACNEVKVQKVSIECRDEDRCPGFYYVQIPVVEEFGLEKQKVEAK